MQGLSKNYPIDTDPTLSGNSDYIVPSQSAVKSYADNTHTYATGSSFADGNSLYGNAGGTKTQWTRTVVAKSLAGNNSFINNWLDGTPFAGFELSPLFYDVALWRGHGSNVQASPGFGQTVTLSTSANGTSETAGASLLLTQASAGTAGAVLKSTGAGNEFIYRGSVAGVNGFLYFDFFTVNGTNWNNTGASTGTRWVSGVGTNGSAAALGSDNPIGDRAMFMRSHVNGGLTETNWMFSTKDSTTENRVSTGVPFSANGARYVTMIACAPQASTIYYRIFDTTNNADSGLLSTSTNLPRGNQVMYGNTGFYNVDAVSRNFTFIKSVIYVRNGL